MGTEDTSNTAGATDQNDQQPPAATQDTSQSTTEVKLSQDELTRKLTAEKNEGKRAAERAIAESLGVSVEKAKEIIASSQEAEKAKLSDADRAKQEAEESKAQATRELAEAKAERHQAKIERALGIAGIPEASLAKVARLVDVEEGADSDAVKAAVEELKTSMPGLFGQQDGNGATNGAPSSTPGGGAPKPKTQDDAFSRGFDKGKSMVAVRTGSTQ